MVVAFGVTAIVMLIALIPAGMALCRGPLADAVIAYEFITAVVVMILLLLAQAFRRPSEFELGVLLAVLLFGSGVVFVRFVERWL